MTATMLTRIIQGEQISRETPVKHKKRKRLSAAFYQARAAKGWETRKRQAAARAAQPTKAEAA